MKTWFAASAIFAISAVGALLIISEPLNAETSFERADNFSKLDYDVFDRDFKLGNIECSVGLVKHKMCFHESPLQSQIVEGEPLKQHIPVLAAEFPILVASPLKLQSQKLLRYGTRLVLIDENSQIVQDVLELSARDV